jgi:hypothetical protein
MGEQFSLQRVLSLSDAVPQPHSVARYWLVKENVTCILAVAPDHILVFLRLQRQFSRQ